MFIFWHWKWPAQGTSTVPVVSAHFRSLLSISLRLTQSITCGYSNDSNNPHRRCALVHNRIALYFSIDSGSAQSCPLPEYPSCDLKFPNPRLTDGSLDPRCIVPSSTNDSSIGSAVFAGFVIVTDRHILTHDHAMYDTLCTNSPHCVQAIRSNDSRENHRLPTENCTCRRKPQFRGIIGSNLYGKF